MQGFMGGRDFAHSIISCARLKHVDQYLDAVEVGAVPHGTGPYRAAMAA